MLGKVSVLIKTFLRDAYLYETIATIRREMPELQLIVVDDGNMTHVKENTYHDLVDYGHRVDVVPFDSGFGFKSNRGMDLCTREYLLIGSDDFDFRGARAGIEKMVRVLESPTGRADIASGRVNNNPYEYWLVNPKGNPEIFKEIPITYGRSEFVDGVQIHRCDLTVNYSLIRRSLLGRDKVHWDDDVKIGGGEHGAFFIDVKRAGGRVVYVNGVNIREQVGKPIDPRYGDFRCRARQPERPCFERRGVKQYYCADGTADIKGGPLA